MDLRSIIILVSRVAGMWLIIWTTLQVVSSIPFYMASFGTEQCPYILLSAFPILIGAILWFFPVKVSNVLLAPDTDDRVKNEHGVKLERAAIVMMGLFAFYSGITELVYFYFYDNELFNLLGREREAAADRYANLYTSLFKIVFSFFIILRAKVIANLLYKAWKYGKNA